MDEKEIRLSRIAPELAAQILAGFARFDAAGLLTEQDIQTMTQQGQCFSADSADSKAVYVMRVLNGTAWIDACQGYGNANWEHLLQIVEMQAQGCKAVGFQTGRKGLVKLAKKQGYSVAGYILRKKLHDSII